jgi:hypothetical protein
MPYAAFSGYTSSVNAEMLRISSYDTFPSRGRLIEPLRNPKKLPPSRLTPCHLPQFREAESAREGG